MFAIKDLHFAYGEKTVFDNFSFEMQKKEILCIVGKNGSGKTTLLKILSTLNYCPDLKCMLDEAVIRQKNLKQYVSFIPSNPPFYENLSAHEYIAWIASLWKKGKYYQEKVDEYMHLLQLSVDKRSEISTYSLGMKYKLYFCTFLALDKPIILLDEPLNSLDIPSREQAIRLIKDYVDKHDGYCIFSSHVKETIYSLATQTISLD